VIPGSRTRCRWVQLLMQPREESMRGCVATVQFSRAVREGVRVAGLWDAPASCAGLSKLNSMRRARARRNAELARSGLVDVPGRSGVAVRVEPVTTRRRSPAREARFRSGSYWNSLERR